jgi:hypothetical protein
LSPPSFGFDFVSPFGQKAISGAGSLSIELFPPITSFLLAGHLEAIRLPAGGIIQMNEA